MGEGNGQRLRHAAKGCPLNTQKKQTYGQTKKGNQEKPDEIRVQPQTQAPRQSADGPIPQPQLEP